MLGWQFHWGKKKVLPQAQTYSNNMYRENKIVSGLPEGNGRESSLILKIILTLTLSIKCDKQLFTLRGEINNLK